MDQNKKDILKHFKDSGHGFETPEGYFEELERQLEKKVNEKSSKLGLVDKNKKRSQKETFTLPDSMDTGFAVPDGYFEELDLDFPVENEKKIFKLKHPGLRILSLSIAASILLFFGIKTLNISDNSVNLNDFQNEDIATWIDSGLVEFDSYEIAEVFSDIELEESLINEEDLFLYFDEIDVENLMIEN